MAATTQCYSPPAQAVVNFVSQGFLKNKAACFDGSYFCQKSSIPDTFFYEAFAQIDACEASREDKLKISKDLIAYIKFIHEVTIKAKEEFLKDLNISRTHYRTYKSIHASLIDLLGELDRAISVFESCQLDRNDTLNVLIGVVVNDLSQLRLLFADFEAKLSAALIKNNRTKDGVYFKIRSSSQLDTLRNKSYEFLI
ncbi:hypothetical protein GOQ04_12500 [Emticicia sp. ODNR4P]|nr:hypothetical protein [Emticicia sp. ODNR4P]